MPPGPDPIIPRKWTLRAGGQRNVFVWGERERSVHTIMKALLWALYLPEYPRLTVEVRIGDRYKPDLIAYTGTEIAPAGVFTAREQPLFWGECGQVGRDKIVSIARRYPETHFAISKWNTGLTPLEALVRDAIDGLPRRAPFDLINFPPDSLSRFVSAEGSITIRRDDLDWMRL